jgi:hypothetical protein
MARMIRIEMMKMTVCGSMQLLIRSVQGTGTVAQERVSPGPRAVQTDVVGLCAYRRRPADL